MGYNVVEKILLNHIEDGVIGESSEIGIRIDQTLTQDATGTMAYLQFEAMGVPKIRTELSVSYVDHNTLQTGFENADDHQYLQDVAAMYGLYFSKAGNGICHQVHLERFGRPGKTLLGSDSHTPTCGGLGMLAIGAGGLDIAVAMAGGLFYLPSPKVIKVMLRGSLSPFVTAKDIILKLLSILSTKGNVGCILEFAGEGLGQLSIPQRATITNMGAELGVTTSIFPSDENTRTFFQAQNRLEQWKELVADEDATYHKVIEINLSELVPLIAKPHSPDNVVTVQELNDLKVNQVLVGSCTNSSYQDLVTVAQLLKGKTIHPDVSFGVAPGSKQVFEMIARDGYLQDIIASGARILESTCGFCIGNGQSPGDKAVSIRSNNRNFFGRSGTASAGIYLASPEVCVAAALNGALIDPREYFKVNPLEVKVPELFLINDNLIIPPKIEEVKVSIRRGPNIGDPPKGEIMGENIGGIITLKVGDKITTDHIMPAGSYLKYRSNVPEYSKYVFYGVDSKFALRCLENQAKKMANIVVGGESYGQGSSREHAALCPMYLGVKVIVVKSMERIHKANLINFGILPLTFVNPSDFDRIEQGNEVEIGAVKDLIKSSQPLILLNVTKGEEYQLNYELTPRQKSILFAGGMLNFANA